MQQAFRLGVYLIKNGITVTHIFTSSMRRAVQTTEQICKGQTVSARVSSKPYIHESSLLVEQDFGLLEGQSYIKKPSKTLNKNSTSIPENDMVFFNGSKETRDSLMSRVNKFLGVHLFPLLQQEYHSHKDVVMIVSHGVLLKHIWCQFISRLPTIGLYYNYAEKHNQITKTFLYQFSQWSNTGYIQVLCVKNLDVRYVQHTTENATKMDTVNNGPTDLTLGRSIDLGIKAGPTHIYNVQRLDGNSNRRMNEEGFHKGWKIVVEIVNGDTHLKSLKRTGGGIGSARHDKKQKRIDTFLLRTKV